MPCGRRSSKTHVALLADTDSPSAPRPFSTRSAPSCCTGITIATGSFSCARAWQPNTWIRTRRRTAATTRRRGLRKTLRRIVIDAGLPAVGGRRARHPLHRARGVEAHRAEALPPALARRVGLPDPGAVVAVLPQQGRLRRRQDHQRLHDHAVRAADPAQFAAGSCASTRCCSARTTCWRCCFRFARAYFMVDMEMPSAYVQFLRSLMPRKPRSEIYNALGPGTSRARRCSTATSCYHLKHSSDKFRIAPGIKGMVMLVFDLPSFPYVFKVIKDFYPAAEGHDARADQGQVPAGEAARPRRPHGRHAGVQRRGLPARALRRRADRRDARSSAPSQLEIERRRRAR